MTDVPPYQVTEADGAAIPFAVIPHTMAVEATGDSIETLVNDGVTLNNVAEVAAGITAGKFGKGIVQGINLANLSR